MRRLILTAALGASFALAVPAFADSAPAAEPTMHEIYETAQGGHLDQAQQMITQVLANHPRSANAHYVQAELYARQGKTSSARSELSVAEGLNPGLTEFNPRSVQELKSQLGLTSGTRALGSPVVQLPARSAPHFPWGTVLILAIAAGVLMMIFRRRNTYAQYPAAGPGPAMGGGAPGYGPGYGPAPMGGGLGSGIAGGLASGLAVGAGVVAGEELAHHFLDGGRHEGGVIPSAEAGEAGSSNSDMGGNDFGANDPGSWDDGGGFGGGGGGGGDDWS
jgi:uncharacterized protein